MAGAEVRFHPDAEAEYTAAAAWYAGRSPAIVEAFEREIEAALVRILSAPDRWPRYDRGHRKVIVHRFPYLLVYRRFEGRVWIVAVAHGRRRPGYWRRRVLTPEPP